ncbi:PHA/PHB synthase family protein [Sphingobium xenophagum]|uniref:PHA/PHB synthase family protein n=1 Tax=Sphingobium xenophagum TaxID=121428 RepID=UPI001C0BB7C2|nr:alpha/beta fold hydrolase [Sphingobium xenophagum]QWT16585.1 alpha/beta fold hydrolase [Sphingobium xenophagum]
MAALPTQASPDPLEATYEVLDKAAFAAIGQATGGFSPATAVQAMMDWGLHLALSPGKQIQLLAKAARKSMRLADYAVRSLGDTEAKPAIEPLPQDRRFTDPAWKQRPFDLLAQGFLLQQQWWHAATTGITGVTRHHEIMMEFAARQSLDMLAPTNFLISNPVLQARIAETGGRCLVDGFKFWIEDALRLARGEPAAGCEAFRPGKEVAAAKGKVVFRNRLIELIQYEPTTEAVRPEPVLIVPAWIMKYYILDLSPHNSLVEWLTSQGFTVFMISWHNPDESDRDLDMEAYRELGPLAALDAIVTITGAHNVHAAGYCLGGTLLAIAAAAMVREGDDRLASVTLFAAQTEFSEPGELGLFIDEAQLNLLDSIMWTQGYLDGRQMGGAFQLLRSNDLIWSRLLTEYLMGERGPPSDLMAWNADATRMPYAMHSEYLHKLFLNNDLAEGRYVAGGRPVSLSALTAPMFVVGTEQDHVAPWRSVHKIHWLTDAEVSFLLTSGGHNAGIVSEPGHPGRSYHIECRPQDEPALSPDEWLERAEVRQGSWWPAWTDWLASHSSDPTSPPPCGAPDRNYPVLGDAPGLYVLER